MNLQQNLQRFKRKYYLNLCIKGSLLALSLLISAFMLVNAIEYFGQLSSTYRTILFFGYLSIAGVAIYFWTIHPAIKLINKKTQLSDEEAARFIGNHFPNVGDKLLNTLQLFKLAAQSELARAGIMQKQSQMENIDFASAIDLRENRKYLRFIVAPFLIGIGIWVFVPQFFTESTPRLIQYHKEFIPRAPFQFVILNDTLQTFQNEDFLLNVKVTGTAIPQAVYLITDDGRRLRLSQQKTDSFTYHFTQLRQSFQFYLEGSGFRSQETYFLEVLERPLLKNFQVHLTYPAYINKSSQTMENIGTLTIPQGTKVEWFFSTSETDSMSIFFLKDRQTATLTKNKDKFSFQRKFYQSENYQIQLFNRYSRNKEPIEYTINVIPDLSPTITVQQFQDTVLFEKLFLGGNITDDYGISALYFKYKVFNPYGADTSKHYASIPISFNKNVINQSYFHQVSLSELNLEKGATIEYFVEVWDNDGVNGRKSARTPVMRFRTPTKAEIKESIARTATNTEQQLDNALDKAKEAKKETRELQERLKSKRRLDWQDKRLVEQMTEQRKELEKTIEQLQEQSRQLNEKQEKNNAFQNERIAEKAKELQKLMDELLDKDTKKLYEELNRLMEQNVVTDDLQRLLEKIEQKQLNLERELDRALEMFKKLKFEMKVEQLKNDLKELSQAQENLAKETEETKKSELEEIQRKQEQLNFEFDQLQKEFDELKKMNQELQQHKEYELEQLENLQKETDQKQENALKELQKNNKKSSIQQQKEAAEKMKQMAQKMEQMQQESEMQQLGENYDDLRQILDNLIKLSFDQEALMKEFRSVKRIDPKFVKLSQQQLKLKEDAKIIEDSLLALSKRVFQLQSFVTREVAEMNRYMDESMEEIRKRVPETVSAKQQFAMTSMNNLALMLNDLLQQMQNQMQSMAGKGQQKNSQKKNQGSTPKLSDLQKQLNQKIEELKKSGKTGRELSEELAKLAAEQEAIRRALQQQQKASQKGEQGEGNPDGKQGKSQNGNTSEDDKNKEGENGQKDGGKTGQLMEETEKDLVNKKLDDELLRRQQEILTRLLESEKAQRERDFDDKREAQQAQEKQSQTSKQFEEYFKLKEKQTELLKTVPPSLSPYYKQQVDEYFKKLK
ncbi:MAG: hypothetical protein NZM38_03820 [Cytophagales bacterium]|nr:hypothetical protein [Cytophagales bacterium]MDW8383879.1 DUF4175 family protein [Flammeovirgaceae bacterium]